MLFTRLDDRKEKLGELNAVWLIVSACNSCKPEERERRDKSGWDKRSSELKSVLQLDISSSAAVVSVLSAADTCCLVWEKVQPLSEFLDDPPIQQSSLHMCSFLHVTCRNQILASVNSKLVIPSIWDAAALSLSQTPYAPAGKFLEHLRIMLCAHTESSQIW